MIDSSTTALPSGLVQQSEGIVYGLAGTDSIIPTGAERTFTIGLQILNRGVEDVSILDIQVADQEGLVAIPELIVGTPRAVSQIASEAGFPPTASWAPEVARHFAPFHLPAGVDSADWGALVLFHVDREADLAFAKGYWVRGTEGGLPFEDFVDVYTVLCGDTDRTPSRACTSYAEAHAFGV